MVRTKVQSHITEVAATMTETNRAKYTGVHVAMNSCYDDNGKVDPERIAALTRFLIGKGVKGVYVGGATGEGVLQTVEERKQTLKAVMDENRGKLTVIAHIGAMTTADSAALAEYANTLGIDAISSIPP